MALNARFVEALSGARSIGIDVSKASLSVCCLRPQGQEALSITAGNDAASVKALVAALVGAGFHGPLVLESTGHYHWRVAVCAAQAGQQVRLLNPLMSSKHSRAAIRKTKTDAVDARQLALMGVTETNLPAPWCHDAHWVVLRHKVGLLAALEKTMQRLQATLRAHREALASMGVEEDAMVEAIGAQIAALQRQCGCAEQALAAHFAARSQDGLHARLHSVPGVAAYMAGLQELFFRPDVASAKSWSAFIGIDISVKQSGTWRGRSRLSKRGNAYLRKRMYQAAWGAMQNAPEFKAYYQHLRAQGRSYKESLLMIARKQLRIAYVLWTQGGTYRPEMLKI